MNANFWKTVGGFAGEPGDWGGKSAKEAKEQKSGQRTSQKHPKTSNQPQSTKQVPASQKENVLKQRTAETNAQAYVCTLIYCDKQYKYI